ncbi:MAG: Holliday junction resolvase RuvX [Clostridia bacterium]|nr:Holliday junction resolvase RuvX [Clostridia bacterium]
MKFICFDIGTKRVGVAVTDPFMNMALPRETYHRKNTEADVKALVDLAKKENADRIVCGLPVRMGGGESEQTAYTRAFIEKLKTVTTIPVVTADERFSTKEATRVLIAGDVRREDRKKYVDSVAASYILEDYLNKLKNTGEL